MRWWAFTERFTFLSDVAQYLGKISSQRTPKVYSGLKFSMGPKCSFSMANFSAILGDI
jgi:hypothetical protein